MLVTFGIHSIGFSQVESDQQIVAGFVVKSVQDDEGVKVVLKPSIVHSSELNNKKLKTIHISNQLDNYVILLAQINQAQSKTEFVKIIKTSSQVVIKK